MNITMNTSHIKSIEELKAFMQGTVKIEFTLPTREEKYHFISETLVQFKYFTERKKNRSVIKKYLIKVTGYSHVHIKRLIVKWKKGVLLHPIKTTRRNTFPCTYGPTDIALLIKADKALNFPHGKAVKESLVREYRVFGKKEYENISHISVSHIYNIRKNSRQYLSSVMRYTKTHTVTVPIGQRQKPCNMGKPGFIRVDSVHQGDLEGVKGVYHINLIDEVTQWEVVCCVPVISNKYLIPALESAIVQFPFKMINFHSDNGSEYINYQVANMLKRLFIEQTKSRSRKTNDQALVEGKNGSVIRKHMGRCHIPKIYAHPIDLFYRKYFTIFLNYHRVCGFATHFVDKKGKIRKKYENFMTPYEKLKSLKNAEVYLKDTVSFEMLDEIAYANSDIEFGSLVQEKKKVLFRSFK